jgi:outer membrane receptor for ferric coprogen and ferric-rhodotorulic acid
MAKSETAASILRAISDEKSLELFRTIASEAAVDSETLRTRMKFTRKQYYSRLSRIVRSGLVKRKSGKYFLTAFGKVVYGTELTIEGALKDYWKLKAIDSLNVTGELPAEERNKLINTLLDNEELRGILVKEAR